MAVLSIPVMLLAKPLLQLRQHSKKTKNFIRQDSRQPLLTDIESNAANFDIYSNVAPDFDSLNGGGDVCVSFYNIITNLTHKN